MAKAKKKHPRRDAEEVAGDAQRVLRSASAIERSHWCSGVAPGQCPTCSLPDPPPAPEREEWEVEALAECMGLDPDAYLRGWRSASAATLAATVLPVELLERDDEDLDGLLVHPAFEE